MKAVHCVELDRATNRPGLCPRYTNCPHPERCQVPKPLPRRRTQPKPPPKPKRKAAAKKAPALPPVDVEPDLPDPGQEPPAPSDEG